MAKRLVAAHGRRLAALALLGALGACATSSAEPLPAAQPAGWRIVERVGEARYAPPGAAAWVSATVGETLVDGSEISTGGGGRLIVHAPGSHISVGPDSRFVLPDREREDPLDQRAGWLRYRIAGAEAQPFRIHTRSLELELLAGVVDVHVNHLATEVTVKEGQVRVATPDGLRQTQMMAGQSAHSGGSDDTHLAVRIAPGAPLQAVDPVIVPALHPRSSRSETPTGMPASSPRAALPALPAVDAAAGSQGDRTAREAPLALRPEAATSVAHATPAAMHAPAQPLEPLPGKLGGSNDDPGGKIAGTALRELVSPGVPRRAEQLVDGHAAESDAAARRRAKLERLTAGMLEQVDPPPPSSSPPGIIR